jgi:hypothetical protein
MKDQEELCKESSKLLTSLCAKDAETDQKIDVIAANSEELNLKLDEISKFYEQNFGYILKIKHNNGIQSRNSIEKSTPYTHVSSKNRPELKEPSQYSQNENFNSNIHIYQKEINGPNQSFDYDNNLNSGMQHNTDYRTQKESHETTHDGHGQKTSSNKWVTVQHLNDYFASINTKI